MERSLSIKDRLPEVWVHPLCVPPESLSIRKEGPTEHTAYDDKKEIKTQPRRANVIGKTVSCIPWDLPISVGSG